MNVAERTGTSEVFDMHTSFAVRGSDPLSWLPFRDHQGVDSEVVRKQSNAFVEGLVPSGGHECMFGHTVGWPWSVGDRHSVGYIPAVCVCVCVCV